METRKHRFSTRVGTSLGDPDAPSPTASVMKSPNVSNLWMDGKRDGHQGAIGGAWLDPDAATRCLGATWEMAYSPPTCTTCRLHVRLHAMEIERRRFAAVEGRVRAGCHPHDGLSRRHGADARAWLAVTRPRGREKALKPFGWLDRRDSTARHPGSARVLRHPCPEPLPGAGAVSPWRTPTRRVEPDRSRARPTGSLDAAISDKPAYSLGPHFACPQERLAGGLAPCDPRTGNGAP